MLNDNVNSDFMGFSERTSIMDHSGGDNNNNNTSNGFNIDCIDEEEHGDGDERGKGGFRRLMKSSKFKNIQVEMLYQRYLLRMNQNNAAHIVWLLFALIFILAIIHGNFFVSRWHENDKCRALSNDSDANFTALWNFTADVNESEAAEGGERCEKVLSAYELLGTNVVQFSLLGLCFVLYTVLLLCLYKQRINEIYLFHVSYAIIISLVIIDVSFSITNVGR
jgi:hypothetical protein